MKRPARQTKRKYISNKHHTQSALKSLVQFFFMVPAIVLLVAGVSLFVSQAHAASGINKQINFQGKLVDNNGLNVADNTYTVVFSLYNVSSGGSATWTETDSVSTSNGVFQVALGAGTPFPGNVDFNSDTWYLGIKVGADTEMTPRIRFSAVPYAFNAAALDGIVATNSATQFTITGGTNALIDLTVNGSLTLGSTIKPTAAGALTVASNGANGLTLDTGGVAAVSIGATANSIIFGATNNPTYSFNGTGAVTFQGTSFTLGNGSTATIQTSSNAGLSILSSGSGNITLGQNAGTGTVVIQPNAGGQAAFIVNDQGSGDILTASVSGTPKFTISNSGAASQSGNLTLNLAGIIGTTNMQPLTIGSSTTGAVTISSAGAGGITFNSASGRVTVATGDFLSTGVNGTTGAAAGDIWYDTSVGKFKINEGGTTKTLCNLTDTGCGTGASITLQNAYNNGPTIDLSQAAGGLTFGTGLGTQNVTIAPNAGGQAALVINDQGLGPILTASASGSTVLVLSHAGNLGIGSSSPQQALTVGSAGNVVTEMAAPSGVTTGAALSGGSLSHATYYYKVTALDANGETVGSTESNGCTTSGSSLTCPVTWNAVVGATSYNVYRASTGSGTENVYFNTTATSYNDTGLTGTSATPPTSSTAYVNKVAYSGNSWLLGGKLGLGTETPLAKLHVSGGTTGGNAAEIIDQIGATTNDILTGSASGATKFSVANSGAIKVAGGQSSDIDTLTTTVTLTIGGSNQNGLTLGRSGATTTINGSGLTIGPTSWTATPTISGLITASSGISVAAGQSYTGAGAVTLSSGAGTALTIDSGTTGALNIGTGANGKTITIGNTSANTALVFNTGGSGNITLGSNTGTGTVVIQPNAGGQAALIIKDNGVGDLLTASAGATPKFIVHNDGSIQTIGGNATADITTITGGNGLTIIPKANAAGAGGGLTLKGANGTGGVGGGLTLDAGTGSTNGTISIGTTNQSGLTLGRSGASTTINGSSLVLGAATSVSGALTITSNSASALTVGANGSTNPVLTVNASTGSVATGLQVLGAATGGTTALSVTDSGTNANLSIDAKGSGTITIGGTSTGNIIIGGSSNGLTFSTTAGPSYAGNGRPTKSIVLSAEYPGAVLTASGSAAISGSMTSDASPSAVTTTANNFENYYMWAATSLGSDQQYTVAVRVTLPKDFSDWATGNAITVDFNTPFTNSVLNSLDVFIYKGGDTTGRPVAFSKANVSSVSKNWAQVTFTKAQLTSVAPTLTTAGQQAVFYLTLHSTNTVNYVQVGDITLNYLAAF